MVFNVLFYKKDKPVDFVMQFCYVQKMPKRGERLLLLLLLLLLKCEKKPTFLGYDEFS